VTAFCISLSGCAEEQVSDPVQKVGMRNVLQSKADRLAKLGKYDEAIAVYREAIQPQYISEEYQKGMAIGAIVEILKIQGKYQESLKEFEWFLRDRAVPSAVEKKKMLKSLAVYAQHPLDSNPIREHIQHIRQTHRANLPPITYNRDALIPSSDLIFLYDTIGDYDAGITFIDEILKWDSENNPEHKGIQVSSTEEIGEQYIFRLRDGVQHHPRWRAYKWIREFLLIREAFEQDKAEGKQGSYKEGKPGRATLALIRSEYFPW
jgi:tetratricopeptide (TPR) repeat protein